MKKFLLRVVETIISNLIVSILLSLLIPTFIVLETHTTFKPISRFVLPLLFWKGTGWVAFVVIIVILVIKRWISKKRAAGIKATPSRISPPPKYHASIDKKPEEREYAGVVWKILVGTDVNPLQHSLPREVIHVWPFPEPYCRECDYQLERKEAKWYCMPCRKYYKIPKELQENTWEKIRRNYERLIVQWGYNNFGIGSDNEKPLRVVIREMREQRDKNKDN